MSILNDKNGAKLNHFKHWTFVNFELLNIIKRLILFYNIISFITTTPVENEEFYPLGFHLII